MTAATAASASVVEEAVKAGFFPPRHTVEIVQVQELTPGVTRLTFRDSYIAQHAKPAQFVNLFSHDPMKLMPRPFGVSEVEGDLVSVIFAVVGKGTAEFSHFKAGDTVDVLGPLGRPFATKEPANYVLVGGGLGVPPLIYAAQCLREQDHAVTTAVFGYRNEHFADPFVGRYADRVESIDESEGNVVTLLDRIESDLLNPGSPRPVHVPRNVICPVSSVWSNAWVVAMAPACCALSIPWPDARRSVQTDRYSPANNWDGGSNDHHSRNRRSAHQSVREP